MTPEGGEKMASDAEIAAAASAVASGNATSAQVQLNNRIASQARFMNPQVQVAQDAQKAAAKRR